jgi:NAD(P)-dependent dehydrogenase (short-subunit alcohol dehydrogenase family)
MARQPLARCFDARDALNAKGLQLGSRRISRIPVNTIASSGARPRNDRSFRIQTAFLAWNSGANSGNVRHHGIASARFRIRQMQEAAGDSSRGAFLATRAALRRMYKQNRGSIVYMCSVHSKEASALKAPFVAARALALHVVSFDR